MENSLCLSKERENEIVETYLPMILNLIPERHPWLYNGIRGVLQDLVMDTFYGAMNQFEGITKVNKDRTEKDDNEWKIDSYWGLTNS
jgi:hypothetical protein